MTRPDRTEQAPCLLLVRQVAPDHPGLDRLLQQCRYEAGLDPYVTRQRLVGWAFGLVERGPRQRLERTAALLAAAGLRCWLVAKPGEAADVDRLRAIEAGRESLVLAGRRGTVRVDDRVNVLAVLGDLSGRLARRQLKQLMAARIYQGVSRTGGMETGEKLKTVWQGAPLLDLHLFDDRGRPFRVLRVRPGGFNPAGLGAWRQPGAAGNMQALLKLVRQRARRFVLDVDFGLAQIPGCHPADPQERDDWRQVNARRLLAYGRLRGAILTSRPVSAGREQDAGRGEAVPAAVGAALAAAEEQAGSPVAGPSVVRRAGEDDRAAPSEPLPPPPEATRGSRDIFAGGRLFGLALFGWGVLAGMALSEGTAGGFLRRYGFDNGLLPALLAVILLAAGLRSLRLKRLIENTPTSRIRSLAMGLVELHGRTRRAYALVAPMTQTPCVWYRVRRYRRRRNPRNNQSVWQLTGVQDSGHVPFLLDDGTGLVRVEPGGAQVRAGRREEGFPGQGNILLERTAAVDVDEKWVEERIDEGTRLYVLGSAAPLRAARQPLRERLIARLRRIKSDPSQMRRFDLDGDGRVDEQEWQEARTRVERELLEESLAAGTAPNRLKAVIGRGQRRGLPFVIAETPSEARLTRGLAWRGYGLVAAAGGVFVWALGLWAG